MRINLSSILVDDQEKALKFYTEKLGFVPMADIPLGEYRWIEVNTYPDQDKPWVKELYRFVHRY